MRILKVNARLPKGPKLPVSQSDPVGANMRVAAMNREVKRRYKKLKPAIIDLFRDIPVYAANAQDAYGYTYDFSASRAAQFSENLQSLIDEIMLDDTHPLHADQFWASVSVAGAYEAGTVIAQQQFASMSPSYAERRTITDIIYSPPYIQRLAIVNASTYSDWKGLTEAARADLAQVIMSAIARGDNPRDVESVIAQRLEVSQSRARSMAQTEITGALRKSQNDEVQETKVLLNMNSAIFWISALLPTTRATHAERSGRVYSPEEVQDFYSRNGNSRNCHCANIPCLLNENGKPEMLPSSLARITDARDNWQKARDKK